MSRYFPAVMLMVACSSPGYLPDGGRPRQECHNGATVIPVKTQDALGQPIEGAQVTAKNTTNGMSQIGLTNGSGFTNQITDELGNGQVEISATNATLNTKQPYIVQVVCGECDCTAMPGTVTLTLTVQ